MHCQIVYQNTSCYTFLNFDLFKFTIAITFAHCPFQDLVMGGLSEQIFVAYFLNTNFPPR